MHCPACESEIAADSVFCPRCGERLDEDTPRYGASISADGGKAHSESPAERFKEKMSGRPAANGGDDDDVESTLWEGGYSPKAMFGHWLGAAFLSLLMLVGIVVFLSTVVLAIVLGVGIALVWLWPLGLLAYRRLAIHYKLTTQRFIHEQGLFSRVTDRIEVIDIDDVGFRQSIIDRFLGVGAIQIESGDRTHPELILRGIDDVARVYDLIDGARRKERVRRGIHIATAGSSGSGM